MDWKGYWRAVWPFLLAWCVGFGAYLLDHRLEWPAYILVYVVFLRQLRKVQKEQS